MSSRLVDRKADLHEIIDRLKRFACMYELYVSRSVDTAHTHRIDIGGTDI